MAAKISPDDQSPIRSRLNTYRPALDRFIFALALLGILTSAHLSIQQSRSFEQGCFGFSNPSQVAARFDCAAVTQSEAGTLLGVSNSVWGLLFYVTIAFLTVSAAFNWFRRRKTVKWGRFVLIGFGFLYTLYLLYVQFFEIGQLCALCLVSAGIVTLLFIAQLFDYATTDPPEDIKREKMKVNTKREFAYMGAMVVLAAVLIGADAAYFSNQQSSPPVAVEMDNDSDGTQASGARQVAERTSIADLNEELPAECRYDQDRGPVDDYGRLVNFFDPSKGDPDAPVTVIEYFDPNCPHCRTLHYVMEDVIETHDDQARFVFKPFVLWQHSIAQSEALYAAAQDGKFFEMIEHQYDNQQPSTGLSESDLRRIATDIGMDPDDLMQDLESEIYRRTLMQQKEEAVEIGVNSTPTVLINGRFVATQSRTAECLRIMIEQAAEG